LIRIDLKFAAPFALALALTGCEARELGAHISPTQAAHVDSTWVKAAKVCWPMLAQQTNSYVSANLGDPIGFRGTFPAYAALTDGQLETIVSSSVTDAPPADISLFSAATSPLLTRQQAIAETSATTDTRDARSPSPDTLCAVHAGTPAGYR